jgi:hypothetical protein
MTGHVLPDAIPYGVFYCRSCVAQQPCDVAYGASHLDPACPLECLVCSERIGEEVDVVERPPLPPEVVTRQTLSPTEREAGRRLARRLALGTADREYPLAIPAPAAAPPPGFVTRAAADLERLLRGTR